VKQLKYDGELRSKWVRNDLLEAILIRSIRDTS